MRTALAAALMLLAGGAQAALQARDLNHDGTIDAVYDTGTDLSWLADANIYGTLHPEWTNPYAGPGSMGLYDAQLFLASFDLYGVTGWRLPTASAGPTCQYLMGELLMPYCDEVVGPELSELASLGATPDPALFRHIPTDAQYGAGMFWTSGYYGGGLGGSIIGMPGGFQIISGEQFVNYVWAVHDGDIALAPEPESYALMLLGLGVLVLRGTRRRPMSRSASAERRSRRTTC